MKINKVRNFSGNLMFGMASRMISLLFPFIIRSITIRVLGTEYLGISNLFSAILQTLNLVELGLGSALVFNMYEPTANHDLEKLCAYFHFYKICYRIIGVFILIAGGVLLPFLDRFINGSYPGDIDLQIVYLVYLLNTVVSYWLFAYKNCIALAYQRTDIESKALIVSQLLMYLIQIMVLLTLGNYYIYIIMLPVFTILKNILVSIKVDKLYPWIKSDGKLTKEEIQGVFGKVKALFGHQVAFTVINSADTIVLSAVLGLTELTIYNNYYYIFSAVVNLFTIFFTSIQAGIGNNLITDDNTNIFLNFKRFRLITVLSIQISIGCLFALYNPFMKIWMGVDLMYGQWSVLMFVFGFFVTQIRRIVTTYKNAAGLWEPDIIKPYIVIMIDIIIDMILIKNIGAIGAMISTILSMGFIAVPWETIVLYKHVFKKSAKEHFFYMGKELLFSVASIFVLWRVMPLIALNGLTEILLKLVITVMIVGSMQFLFHAWQPELLWIIARAKILLKTGK